jgi:hypothetical protein
LEGGAKLDRLARRGKAARALQMNEGTGANARPFAGSGGTPVSDEP